MVRYINKNLKAHNYKGDEEILDFISLNAFNRLTTLLTLHTKNLGQYSPNNLQHLLQKLSIQLNISDPASFDFVLSDKKTKLKDLFLLLEIILESLLNFKHDESLFLDFINDFNEFFLINGVSFQIRYIPSKGEFYVERIINEEVSKKITETLDSISHHNTTFQDFKNSLKEFSVGNYSESIKLCCKSVENYLCLLLNKKSCSSIKDYYKKAAKKLEIPEDLNVKFNSLVNYIHKHRSIDSHGKIEEVRVDEIDLVNETIIIFTMAIINYLSKKEKY